MIRTLTSCLVLLTFLASPLLGQSPASSTNPYKTYQVVGASSSHKLDFQYWWPINEAVTYGEGVKRFGTIPDATFRWWWHEGNGTGTLEVWHAHVFLGMGTIRRGPEPGRFIVQMPGQPEKVIY